jgi:hypothetical protein
MSQIYDIGIDDITVYIPEPNSVHPPVLPNIHPPVTVDLGFPVVEIPGCVEAHQDNNREGKPWDKKLVENDPEQVMVLCPHGSYPSYDAMNFEPERVLPTITPPPPPVPPPTPPIPDTSKVTLPDDDVECPGPNSPRIGDVAQNKTERVSGFKLSDDGKICIVLYEDIPFTAQYLPAPQVAATTGGIAVVATTSALLAKPLADLLLKVVKPVVKKVIAKVNAIRGKEEKRLSVRERLLAQRDRNRAVMELRKALKK